MGGWTGWQENKKRESNWMVGRAVEQASPKEQVSKREGTWVRRREGRWVGRTAGRWVGKRIGGCMDSRTDGLARIQVGGWVGKGAGGWWRVGGCQEGGQESRWVEG